LFIIRVVFLDGNKYHCVISLGLTELVPT